LRYSVFLFHYLYFHFCN